MKGPRQPLPLFLKAEVSVSQSAGKEDSPRTTPSFGFQGDTKMKEQERRHSLNSSLHFSPLYCKVSTESRGIRDAVRARLYRHSVLLSRKTKVPIPPLFSNQTKPAPHGFCSRKLAPSFSADLTGTGNSHTGTRSSADQRVSMKK